MVLFLAKGEALVTEYNMDLFILCETIIVEGE